MKIARFINPTTGQTTLACKANNQCRWQKVSDKDLSVMALMDMTCQQVSHECEEIQGNELDNLLPILPFQPSAYRDFMLYEKHAIDAARGFVKKYLPNAFPIVQAYEKLLAKPFPKLRPAPRYYRHPIYYMGNHLNIVPDGASVNIPEYTQQLDYELEIAAFINKPLKNASPAEAREAIAGFMILNDFSARDIQLDEIKTGFGPMKTKNFASSLSTCIVSSDAIIDKIDDLQVKVFINDSLITDTHTGGKLFSFEQAIAYASWEEQLHPGELFGSGTVPGCAGIENNHMLSSGDTIRLEVEHLGTLTNSIT